MSALKWTGQLRKLRASVWTIVALGLLMVVLIKQMAAQGYMSNALFVSMLITLVLRWQSRRGPASLFDARAAARSCYGWRSVNSRRADG
jgi:hypothetical protein